MLIRFTSTTKCTFHSYGRSFLWKVI